LPADHILTTKNKKAMKPINLQQKNTSKDIVKISLGSNDENDWSSGKQEMNTSNTDKPLKAFLTQFELIDIRYLLINGVISRLLIVFWQREDYCL
jgi:hypothetical protein